MPRCSCGPTGGCSWVCRAGALSSTRVHLVSRPRLQSGCVPETNHGLSGSRTPPALVRLVRAYGRAAPTDSEHIRAHRLASALGLH